MFVERMFLIKAILGGVAQYSENTLHYSNAFIAHYW